MFERTATVCVIFPTENLLQNVATTFPSLVVAKVETPDLIWRFFLPTLLGNVVGDVAHCILGHAEVMAGVIRIETPPPFAEIENGEALAYFYSDS